MIQTKPCREALTRNCLVEHAAQCDSVDGGRLQAKSNNGAGELIHHDQDPMRPQMDGFNLKQVHAQQAVFGLTQQDEPSRTTTADFVPCPKIPCARFYCLRGESTRFDPELVPLELGSRGA